MALSSALLTTSAVTGADQSRYARIASAQASGVRNAAIPAFASSASDLSACGTMKAAKGLFLRSAEMMGSTASSG